MVEKIKKMVLEGLLWKKLNVRIVTVIVTVLCRNILICMGCVLVQPAHAVKG